MIEFLKPKIAEPATISSAAAADRLRPPAETNVMCVVWLNVFDSMKGESW